MKVTFLGTGTSSGVPMIGCDCEVCKSSDTRDKRLRTSVYVELPELCFTIDAGPDFRQQILRENIQHLDAVIITHAHRDHVGGLDEVRAFNFLSGKDFDIYLDAYAEKTIRTQYDYAFSGSKYPGIPRINLISIGNAPFEIKGNQILPIQVLHHKLPVLGFRIGDFTYITDANQISAEEKEKIKGSKVLVLNALRHEKHISHFTLQEAIDLVHELKPEHAYFTHISHQLGRHEIVQAGLPAGITLAHDGLQIRI